jgi:peroxiredoxin Q/BCP
VEGADFRDRYEAFRKAGAEVVGVSRDSLKAHEGFKAKMKFPFELLSDAEEKLCAQFGVIKMKNMYGKKVRGIERSTFVIDRDGVLAREWRGVKVPGHAEEVLNFVKAL